MINKMIIESCKNRKRNLSYAWIDYKKAFDNVSRVTEFLKHNIKKWTTKLSLTHKSGTLMFDKINMQKRIFQGDYLYSLLFCISPKPLSLELNSSGYGYKIGTEQIRFLFYMDDLKL